uniref:Uncharacterized protein n=1 Tax=Lepeophtheirus salmonis TaxID=72036 RepID=A0A0K2T859_LEPSM
MSSSQTSDNSNFFVTSMHPLFGVDARFSRTFSKRAYGLTIR